MKNFVSKEREKINLTQEDLAKKVGVSRQTIIAIEKGDSVPSLMLALKIAHVFGKCTDEVFILE